jgi:hypothetical protein
MGCYGQILGGGWPDSMPAFAIYATLLGAPQAGPESGSDCMTAHPSITTMLLTGWRQSARNSRRMGERLARHVVLFAPVKLTGVDLVRWGTVQSIA